MVAGVLAARRRDLVLHRRAMQHVVGQMSVAVVSRALIVGFDAMGIDPDLSYAVALWGPVLASVAVVEVALLRSVFSTFNSLKPIGRIRREVPPLLVRIRTVVNPVARLGR